MMKTRSLLTLALLGAASSTFASVVVWDPADLSAPTAILADSNSTVGIWFNVLTGDAFVNNDPGFFPGLVDGQYQLRSNTFFFGNPAQVLVQGLFANGNGLLGTSGYPGFDDGTPARLDAGELIDPDNFPEAIFINMSGIFGLWDEEGLGTPGYLGLKIANGSDIHYGWAEVIIGDDPNATLTLTRFAFNSTPDQGLFAGTAIAIPEASVLGLLGMGATSLFLGLRRRR